MTLLRNSISSQLRNDHLLLIVLWGLGVTSSAIIGLILFFLFNESLPFLIKEGVSQFFLDASWHPTEGLFNLSPMLLGSLLIMGGSTVLATPLGILSSLFCRFYAPKPVAAIYRKLIELLAGIPSVVYGFWGLVTLVPLIGQFQPPGTSLFAGILILTLMILPTITLLTDAAFSNVPQEYLTGAQGLGLSRWTTIKDIVLPFSKTGILTGIILAAGRAIGETMALLMICGNIVKVPGSLFDPVRTLTSNIALEMAYAMGDHRSALFVSGLILTVLITALTFLAHGLSRGSARV